MRLSRTDLLPVMVIIGGGAVGVLASGSLLLSSRAAHVRAPLPFVVQSDDLLYIWFSVKNLT